MKIYESLAGEKEILQVRKFPYFLMLIMIRFIKRILIPMFLGLFILYIFNSNFIKIESFQIFLAFYFIYISFLLLIGFVEWLNEELDLFIITDKRIIIFIQKTFFNRHSSIASLNQIQDVKGEVQGMFFSFLNVGNLEIKTAADNTCFIIDEIKDPEKVARILNNAMEKAKTENPKASILDHISHNNFLDTALQHTRHKIKNII
jgi:uncharacterized membrane protein YdbT with pleckstrin-like domain